MKFKIGDIVKSKWNTYDKNASCVVDRVYKRKDNTQVYMLRLRFYYKGEEKKINVPEHACELDISYMRNQKLNKLFDSNN